MDSVAPAELLDEVRERLAALLEIDQKFRFLVLIMAVFRGSFGRFPASSSAVSRLKPNVKRNAPAISLSSAPATANLSRSYPANAHLE